MATFVENLATFVENLATFSLISGLTLDISALGQSVQREDVCTSVETLGAEMSPATKHLALSLAFF